MTQASGIRNYTVWFLRLCYSVNRVQVMSDVSGEGQVISVSLDQTTVCCRGAKGALGHPAVYLTFAEQSAVQCYYCGCEYTQADSEYSHKS